MIVNSFYSSVADGRCPERFCDDERKASLFTLEELLLFGWSILGGCLDSWKDSMDNRRWRSSGSEGLFSLTRGKSCRISFHTGMQHVWADRPDSQVPAFHSQHTNTHTWLFIHMVVNSHSL